MLFFFSSRTNVTAPLAQLASFLANLAEENPPQFSADKLKSLAHIITLKSFSALCFTFL